MHFLNYRICIIYFPLCRYYGFDWIIFVFEFYSENGFKNVQFHIQGNLTDYTKEHQQNIVEVVADILDCETLEIFVNGVKPSNSFFLVLSFKEVYTWKLLKMGEQDHLKLMNLNIDFLIVDKNTIYFQNVKGKSYYWYLFINYIYVVVHTNTKYTTKLYMINVNNIILIYSFAVQNNNNTL